MIEFLLFLVLLAAACYSIDRRLNELSTEAGCAGWEITSARAAKYLTTSNLETSLVCFCRVQQ